MAKITEYTNNFKPELSGRWQVDEQEVKAGKKWLYNWNVLDEETRFLLATQTTKGRRIKEARNVLRKAKEFQEKPTQIKTDGYNSYIKAVKREFPTHKVHTKGKVKHIRNVGVNKKENNNLIERYHGNYRDREKTFRGLQNNKTAQQYGDNFRTYYNFLRQHKGLDGLTPAQASGIDEPREIKALLLKSLAKKN